MRHDPAMELTGILLAAAVAAPGGGLGPAQTMAAFQRLVETRPRRACRRYLTPRARRQWDSFESLPCRWKTAAGPFGDRRAYRVVLRPAPRVARVSMRLLGTPICGDLDPETISTVVHRDGRWRIARFGTEMGCMPPE